MMAGRAVWCSHLGSALLGSCARSSGRHVGIIRHAAAAAPPLHAPCVTPTRAVDSKGNQPVHQSGHVAAPPVPLMPHLSRYDEHGTILAGAKLCSDIPNNTNNSGEWRSTTTQTGSAIHDFLMQVHCHIGADSSQTTTRASLTTVRFCSQ